MKAKEYVEQFLNPPTHENEKRLSKALVVEFDELVRKRKISTPEGRERLKKEFRDKIRKIKELWPAGVPPEKELLYDPDDTTVQY
jgi:hypothetical protein